MEWISVKDHPLPRDGSIFLSLWKGAIAFSQYDVEEGLFYLVMYPASLAGIMKVAKDREHKYTHWMKLERPVDY